MSNEAAVSNGSEQPISTSTEKTNGQIVTGDLAYDGRVILYIIKGRHSRRQSNAY